MNPGGGSTSQLNLWLSHFSCNTAGTSSSVESIIKAEYSSLSVFNSQNSYQSLALTFTKNTSTGLSSWKILQRYALACIYYATYNVQTAHSTAAGFSGGWFNSNKWLAAQNECEWYGVTCDSSGKVQTLDLSSNGLTGSFPNEVKFMKSSLLELNIEKNIIHNVGLAWVEPLTKVEVLLIGHNPIEGNGSGLPSVLKKLTKLVSLDVSYCFFVGVIDDSFFSVFPDLEYLDLTGNAFTGNLPSTMANLWSLKFAYISDNGFQGTLDVILKSSLPILEEFWADDNEALNAYIPSEVGNLVSLKSLSLANCNLQGSIPKEMGQLVALEQLWLNENELSGNVPTGLGALTALVILRLENNSLSGTMPSAVCVNAQWGYLDVLGADTSVSCSCCTCRGNACKD